MHCNETQLTLYWSGELPADEAATVEAHLKVCEACRTELAELNGLQNAMADLPQENAPRDFVAAASAKANRPPLRLGDFIRKPSLACPLFGSLAAAAALLLILAGPWNQPAGQTLASSPMVTEDLGAQAYAKAKQTIQQTTTRMTTARRSNANFRVRTGTLVKRIQMSKRTLKRSYRHSRTTRRTI